MTKQKRKLSLNMQVIIFEVVMICLAIMGIWLLQAEKLNQLEEKNARYLESTMNQVISNINTQLVSLNNIMYNLTYSRDIQLLLKENKPINLFLNTKKIDDYITQLSLLNKEMLEVIIISENDIHYHKNYNNIKWEALNSLVDNATLGQKPQILGLSEYNDQSVLTFANTIYEEGSRSKKIGTLVVLVKDSMFKNELDSEFIKIQMMNNDNHIIFSNDVMPEEDILDFPLDKISIRDNWYLQGMNAKLVGVIDENSPIGDISSKDSYFYIIIFIMLLVVVMNYLFMTYFAVIPLRTINDFIKTIRKGDLRKLKKRITINTNVKEIENIASEINKLLDEVNSLSVRLVTTTSNLYDAELSKKEAEISFLKSQINPHFLYNTLGIIKGLAMINDEKEIGMIAGSLAKIFRYSIKGNDEVKFFEEIDIIKAYVEIQKSRFSDRFTVEYDIEDHLYEIKIQKMILQPIVENAIFHGIEPSHKKCVLRISAYEDEKYINIVIEDDGVGMGSKHVDCLLNKFYNESNKATFKEHIGIMNVYHRLRHTYGDQAKINITSNQSIGTKITLCIPSDQIE